MLKEMKACLEKMMNGEVGVYGEFKKAYGVIPLQEAENLLSYLTLERLDFLPAESSETSVFLLDMGILADGAACHYEKQGSKDQALIYANKSCDYWQKSIADYDDRDAHYRLGRWYLRKWPLFEVKVAEGLKHIEAAAKLSQGDALFYLGQVHDSGSYPGKQKMPSEAVKCWKAAMEAGHVGAIYHLARLHESGYEDVIDSNPNAAFDLLTNAANKGHPKAAFSLWVIYSQGANAATLTVAQDVDVAKIWLQRSAKLGDAMGQYILGKGYLEQGNTQAQIETALALLQASAQQGHKDAALLFAKNANRAQSNSSNDNGGVEQEEKSNARVLN